MVVSKDLKTLKDLKCCPPLMKEEIHDEGKKWIEFWGERCKECSIDKERQNMDNPEEFKGYCIECEARGIAIGFFNEFLGMGSNYTGSGKQ